MIFDAPYLGSTQTDGISSVGAIAASVSSNGDNEPPNIGRFRQYILCP